MKLREIMPIKLNIYKRVRYIYVCVYIYIYVCIYNHCVIINSRKKSYPANENLLENKVP